MADRTERIQVTLTPDEADAVRAEAAARSVAERKRVSMSDVIRALVTRWCEQHAQKSKGKGR